MNKLVTEDDVRQLVKTKALDKNSEFLVTKGTILTPSARGFLIDRQIKIRSRDKESGINSEQLPVQTFSKITQRLVVPKINFEQLGGFTQPVEQLKIALRKQTIILLRLFSETNSLVDNSDFVDRLVLFVNSILKGDIYEYQKNPNIDELSLEDMVLSISTDKIFYLVLDLQNSISEMAVTLKNFQLIYPTNKMDIFQDICRWENYLQDWTFSKMEEGEKNE